MNKKEPKQNLISRRNFIGMTATTGAAFTILPSFVVSGLGHKAPSDKLNIAGIGIGGKGAVNIGTMSTENIVALCDVDWDYAKNTFEKYPGAKRFWDYRKMFDEMGKDIDAVMIATADHTHAIIAADAMVLGKHVFCQKPLTHSVYESRLLTQLARKYKVATQMGHQGSSSPEVRTIREWIANGEIGEVTEAHAWTNRPLWPQGLSRPAEEMAIPETLNWDLFIGPAQMRPYNRAYHPWDWRGWWDFGTGALGDMACHILDPVYSSLELGYPTEVEGSSTAINTDGAPQAQIVEYTFPKRKSSKNKNLPEVKVTWYDGGLMPRRPKELADGVPLMEDDMGACLFVGTKDKLMCNLGGIKPRLLSGRVPNVAETLRRIPGYKVGGIDDVPHAQDWIRACKESPENRVQSTANFDYAGPFNEMVVMGVLAVRLQALNRVLKWDGENMQFTNISDTDELPVTTVGEYTVKDGHPSFGTKTAMLNAKKTVNEFIKHNYREGWNLSTV